MLNVVKYIVISWWPKLHSSYQQVYGHLLLDLVEIKTPKIHAQCSLLDKLGLISTIDK